MLGMEAVTVVQGFPLTYASVSPIRLFCLLSLCLASHSLLPSFHVRWLTHSFRGGPRGYNCVKNVVSPPRHADGSHLGLNSICLELGKSGQPTVPDYDIFFL